MENRKKGSIAEDKAIFYLKEKGYNILYKNFYSIYGEIDIIAKKDNMIIFFEVKYRSSLKNGYPREAISKSKQEKIKKTALIYISENNILNSDFSFDIIEILNNEITHIENAFYY